MVISMLVIGILLLIVALVVFGFLWFGTEGLAPIEVDLGVFTASLSPLQLFLLGAATLVVLVLGLVCLVLGLRAARRRRKEVRELRKVAERQPETVSRRHPEDREVITRSRDETTTDTAAADTADWGTAGSDARSSGSHGSGSSFADGTADEPRIALPGDAARRDPVSPTDPHGQTDPRRPGTPPSA